MNKAQELISSFLKSDMNKMEIDDNDNNSFLYKHLKDSKFWNDETSIQQMWDGFLVFKCTMMSISVVYTPMETIRLYKDKE